MMLNLPMHIRKPSQHSELTTFNSWDFSSQAPASIRDDDFEFDSNSLLTNGSGDEHDDVLNTGNANNKLDVSVSGAIFSIDSDLFRRVEPLPWSYQRATEAHGGFEGYSLHMSPYIFQQLISFLEDGSLPLLARLSVFDKEELELLAAMLNLQKLQNHLNRKGRPRAPSSLRLRNRVKSQSSVSTSSVSSSCSSSVMETSFASTVKRRSGLFRRSSQLRKMTHREMSALTERLQ